LSQNQKVVILKLNRRLTNLNQIQVCLKIKHSNRTEAENKSLADKIQQSNQKRIEINIRVKV